LPHQKILTVKSAMFQITTFMNTFGLLNMEKHATRLMAIF